MHCDDANNRYLAKDRAELAFQMPLRASLNNKETATAKLQVDSPMEKLDPDFRPLLRNYDLDALDAQSCVTYGLRPDFRLSYLNSSWFRFAAQNGGEPEISDHWGLGTSIFRNMPTLIRDFYNLHYNKCLHTDGVWSHLYECSSDSVFRTFYQTAYSLDRGNGLLVTNSIVIERPHDPLQRPVCAADDAAYRDKHGFLHQCSHCRRVQNLSEPMRWDWVPEWVRRIPENTSHTFCPSCYGHYYPVGGVK